MGPREERGGRAGVIAGTVALRPPAVERQPAEHRHARLERLQRREDRGQDTERAFFLSASSRACARRREPRRRPYAAVVRRSAAGDSRGMIDSNHGNAIAVPMPRKTVRREICRFLPMAHSLFLPRRSWKGSL